MIARISLSIGLVPLVLGCLLIPDDGLADFRGTIERKEAAPPFDTLTEDQLEIGRWYMKEQKYELAIDTYTKALQGNAPKFDLYIGRARAYIKLGRYYNALADANLAIQENPQHPLGFVYRGWAHGYLSHYKEAITELTHAIELSPSVSQFYIVRGGIYLEAGRPEDALHDYSRAIMLGKGQVNPIVFYHRAIAFQTLDRYEDALQDLSEALERDPSLLRGRRQRGGVYRCLGQYSLAKSDLDTVLQQNPDDLEARLQRAFLSIELEEFRLALTDLLYADSQGMKDPYLLLYLAYVHFRLGRVSDALAVNDRLIHQFPGRLQAMALLQQGVLLMASGRSDAARLALAEGQRLAEEDKNLASIEDVLDELERLQARHAKHKNAVELSRVSLQRALQHLRTQPGLVKHRCHNWDNSVKLGTE